MAIPNYQTVMKPFLVLLSDEKVHTLQDTYERLASEFKLTADELNEVLPSGNQKVFHSRVGWARTYLKKAALLEQPARAQFCITPRGLAVIAQNPKHIDNAYLEQFPEFVEFVRASQAKRLESKGDDAHEATELVSAMESSLTPEELIERAYSDLKFKLLDELLTEIKQRKPQFFEQLVVRLMIAMGYGGSRQEAGRAIGRSGDGGIDGIINEDRLGLDAIYLQAKRWDGNVGRPDIQAFVGALQGQRAHKGVFITTSAFTKEALEYVKNIQNKVVLIDGRRLAELMIEYNLGVSTVETYAIKRIDSDFFAED